jgi:hypothetical protein
MFIIFLTETNQILSYGQGTPTESENKLYLGDTVICNDLSICDWKYIEEQVLEQDEGGFVHDADYYPPVTPPTDRLAAVEMALLELGEAML